MVNSPVDGATWEVGSLRSVSWDSSLMAENSTIDAALMHHEMKQAFLLRRYVLAQSGSCSLNLPPEVTPGTYSLLLTVYKKRTTTVLGRSLVSVIHIVDKRVLRTLSRVQASSVPADASLQGQNDTRDDRALLQPTAAIQSKSQGRDWSLKNTVVDQEKIHIINESGGKVRVRRAPYTLGWEVPKALRDVPNVRADILLVESGHKQADSDRKVERALVTNLSAHAGFHIVLLPMDLLSPVKYRLQIVISGAGRTFVGYSRAFSTTPPAYAD